MSLAHDPWPELRAADWRDTRAALHMILQIVGKYKLARTPWLNHSWHATFLPTASGLTTLPIPDGDQTVQIEIDVIADAVVLEAAHGGRRIVALRPMSVAEFHEAFRAALRALGASDRFHGAPNEVEAPIPFAEDDAPRPYDGDAVRRFHRALLSATHVLERYRTGFVGKSTPAHLFWGSFDLAVTRFSGRPAPLHPGGIPALPDSVTQEAYSHEVASAGFWPGGGIVDEAAFYAYAYPEPEGYGAAALTVPGAYYDPNAHEFFLPYDAVRNAPDPAAALTAFLMETFNLACDLGGWDRDALVCSLGEPLRPRLL